MAIYASTSSKPRELAPIGNHRASCVGIFDLGTQPGGEYGPKRKVLFQWELTDEFMEDGRPFVVSEKYNLSTHEKATLRNKVINSWRGKPLTAEEAKKFDITVLLGKPCMISVVHNEASNGNTYANVATISVFNKSTPKPEKIHNPLRMYSLDDGDKFPEGTPDWIVGLINESEERVAELAAKKPTWANGKAPSVPGEPAFAVPGGDDDDLELPF